MTQSLADLRALLHSPPSAKLWQTLCETLDFWPKESQTIALDYALHHLNTAWPTALRILDLTYRVPPHHRASTPLARTLSVSSATPASAIPPHLPHITSVVVTGRCSAWNTLSKRIQSHTLPALHTLSLRDVPLQNYGLRTLLNALPPDTLKALSLQRCSISTLGVSNLLNHPAARSVHTLNLSGNPLDTEAARAFSTLPTDALPNLQHLDLSSIPFLDRDIPLLAFAPCLRQLRTFQLTSTRLTPQGWTSLVQAPFWGNHPVCNFWCNKRLTDATITAMMSSSWLRKTTHLDLSGNQLSATSADAIAQSPHLTALQHLDLRFNQIGPDGARRLAHGRSLPNLRTLLLTYNPIQNEGARALLSSEALPSLQRLTLNRCDLSNSALIDLPTIPSALPALQHLDLRSNPIQDQGLLALLKNPRSSNLHELYIDLQNVSPAAALAFAHRSNLVASPSMHAWIDYKPSSPHLDLSGQSLTSTHIAVFASSPHLTKVTHLNLSHNALDRAGAYSIGTSSALTSVEALDLSHNPLTNEGAQCIAASTQLGSLRSLNLCATHLDSSGAQTFFDRLRTPLVHLDLSQNSITDLEPIVDSVNLGSLTHLNMSHNPLSLRAFQALLSSSALSSLTHLDLSHTPLSTGLLDILQRSVLLPHLRVLTLDTGLFTPDELARIPSSLRVVHHEPLPLPAHPAPKHAEAPSKPSSVSSTPAQVPKKAKKRSENHIKSSNREDGQDAEEVAEREETEARRREKQRKKIEKRQNAKSDRQRKQRARDKERAKERRKGRGKS